MADPTMPVINSVSPLVTVNPQPFQNYLPMAFDDNLTLLQKVNAIINNLNTMGTSTNSVISQWNSVMTWIEGNGLNDSVSTTLNQWLSDGTLNSVVTQGINSLSTIILNAQDFNFKADYVSPTQTGTDNLQAFKDLVSKFPNGARVVFPQGNYYVSDENQLPTLMQGFEFLGIGSAMLVFGQTCGSSTNVIPSASNVPNWKSCKFTNIIFNAPNSTGYSVFTSGSRDLKFYDCEIRDVASHFVQGTDDRVHMYQCRFTTPTKPTACLMTVGNVTKDLIIKECDYSGMTPRTDAVGLISATNDNRLIGNYYIEDNVFLSPSASVDAMIDLEPNNVQLQNVVIKNNTLYNGKIYVGSGDNVVIEGNTILYTSSASGVSGNPIEFYNAYLTQGMGRVEVRGNRVILADHVGYIYKQPIGVKYPNTIDTLIIEDNELLANGSLNSGDNNVINVDTTGGTINNLIIRGNGLGFTSVPSTKFPYIEIGVYNANTVNRLIIEENRLIGTKSAATSLFKVNQLSGSSTVDFARIQNNHVWGYGLNNTQDGSPVAFNHLDIDEINPTNASLISPWANKDTTTYNGATYRQEGKRVYLQGVVTGGTVGTSIYTLPAGKRPPKNEERIIYTDDGNVTSAFGRVTIQIDGNIILNNGQTVHVSLDGLYFDLP